MAYFFAVKSKAKCNCNHRQPVVKSILVCLIIFLIAGLVCLGFMGRAEERKLIRTRWELRVAASAGAEEGVRLYKEQLQDTNLNITAVVLWTNIVDRYNATQPDVRLEY